MIDLKKNETKLKRAHNIDQSIEDFNEKTLRS